MMYTSPQQACVHKHPTPTNTCVPIKYTASLCTQTPCSHQHLFVHDDVHITPAGLCTQTPYPHQHLCAHKVHSKPVYTNTLLPPTLVCPWWCTHRPSRPVYTNTLPHQHLCVHKVHSRPVYTNTLPHQRLCVHDGVHITPAGLCKQTLYPTNVCVSMMKYTSPQQACVNKHPTTTNVCVSMMKYTSPQQACVNKHSTPPTFVCPWWSTHHPSRPV